MGEVVSHYGKRLGINATPKSKRSVSHYVNIPASDRLQVTVHFIRSQEAYIRTNIFPNNQMPL